MAIGDALADAPEAKSGVVDADIAAIAAVLRVLAGVDTPEIAADDAGAVETRAAAAITGAALPVVLAGLLVLDAGSLRTGTGAAVEVERLAVGATGHATRSALFGAIGTGTNALICIGADGAAGAAIGSAGK